jgi:hypothetical protein
LAERWFKAAGGPISERMLVNSFLFIVFLLCIFGPAIVIARGRGGKACAFVMLRHFLWLIIFFSPLIYWHATHSVIEAMKPVIYLYPPATEKVKVELEYKGGFRTTYPAYDPAIRGWSVTARPDGTLVNDADGREYSYLFWDGKAYDFPADMSEGFVVKGSDTAPFLQATLARLGLTPREYNEFIVYWLPQMQGNPYNLIRFAGREYASAAPLKVIPKPDSMLRVFMLWKPLQEPININEQALPSFDRHGFTVIEWGGTEVAP